MTKTPTRPSKTRDRKFVIGRQAFAKISAVEGLVFTASMTADFVEFERKKLSAPARRKEINRRYGKKT